MLSLKPKPTWATAAASHLINIPQLKHLTIQRRPLLVIPTTVSTNSLQTLKEKPYGPCTTTAAAASRRQVRWDNAAGEEETEETEEGNEEYNQEIAMLEFYTQSCRGEALIVHASVDGQLVEVLIFRGFSSCLNYGTAADPSKSVIPARAVIESIDRIRGPFDPSNIQYLEKEISWDSFKTTRLAAASSPVQ